MKRYTTLLALALLVLVQLPALPAQARVGKGRLSSVIGQKLGNLSRAQRRTRARARAGLIRAGIQLNGIMKANNTRVTMPSSKILSQQVAAAKAYGDSWTCRESSRLLVGKLAQKHKRMSVDSSGKNTFKWGNEGWVSYHYYVVDKPGRPTLLMDPTATSNFGRDVGPGGMMSNLLQQVGRDLGHARAAQNVARRIATGGVKGQGLLVLASPKEIAVYQEVLERAARLKAQATRDAERN